MHRHTINQDQQDLTVCYKEQKNRREKGCCMLYTINKHTCKAFEFLMKIMSLTPIDIRSLIKLLIETTGFSPTMVFLYLQIQIATSSFICFSKKSGEQDKFIHYIKLKRLKEMSNIFSTIKIKTHSYKALKSCTVQKKQLGGKRSKTSLNAYTCT